MVTVLRGKVWDNISVTSAYCFELFGWLLIPNLLGHNTKLVMPKILSGEFRFYFLIRLDLRWIWSLSKCFTCPFCSEIFFDTPYTSARSMTMLVLDEKAFSPLRIVQAWSWGNENFSLYNLQFLLSASLKFPFTRTTKSVCHAEALV